MDTYGWVLTVQLFFLIGGVCVGGDPFTLTHSGIVQPLFVVFKKSLIEKPAMLRRPVVSEIHDASRTRGRTS